MIKTSLLFIFLFTTTSLLSCDWDVVKFEHDTFIYDIVPVNENELASYSYDGFGNMDYQYSSDNGSTWELIREEDLTEKGGQPEKIQYATALDNFVFFFRTGAQILVFNTEDKSWDSTNIPFNTFNIAKRVHRNTGKDIKVIIYDEDEEGNGNAMPLYLITAKYSNGIEVEKELLFPKGSEPSNWSSDIRLFYNDKVYFLKYDEKTYLDRVFIYDIKQNELDSMMFTKDRRRMQFFNHGDGIYFADSEKDSVSGNSTNGGLFKYVPKTGTVEEIYRFDNNYYSAPYYTKLSDDKFLIQITNTFYLFEDDKMYKKASVPNPECEECQDRKESLTFNPYNNYFYYTTRYFCLFRSSDYYDELISPETSVEYSSAFNSGLESVVLSDQQHSFELDIYDKINSISLHNLEGASLSPPIVLQGTNGTQFEFSSQLNNGIYILTIWTSTEVKNIKILKI